MIPHSGLTLSHRTSSSTDLSSLSPHATTSAAHPAASSTHRAGGSSSPGRQTLLSRIFRTSNPNAPKRSSTASDLLDGVTVTPSSRSFSAAVPPNSSDLPQPPPPGGLARTRHAQSMGRARRASVPPCTQGWQPDTDPLLLALQAQANCGDVIAGGPAAAEVADVALTCSAAEVAHISASFAMLGGVTVPLPTPAVLTVPPAPMCTAAAPLAPLGSSSSSSSAGAAVRAWMTSPVPPGLVLDADTAGMRELRAALLQPSPGASSVAATTVFVTEASTHGDGGGSSGGSGGGSSGLRLLAAVTCKASLLAVAGHRSVLAAVAGYTSPHTTPQQPSLHPHARYTCTWFWPPEPGCASIHMQGVRACGSGHLSLDVHPIV